MKKRICLILCFILIIVLSGCGNGSDNTSSKVGNQSLSVKDVIDAAIAEAESTTAAENIAATDAAAAGAIPETSVSEPSDNKTLVVERNNNVDVDLTTLSSTMVYSEVYNMVTSPDNYLGKIIKMNGLFATYHDEAADTWYFACIIQDATACCSQGIEFVLAGDYTYPQDYPKEGEEISVIGVFDTYQEGSYTYCTLRNAKFV